MSDDAEMAARGEGVARELFPG
ncbi:MAG: hypothetical protein QOF33_2009, partial [Thermomicrobiales bacterium]|nr:hypothetical protein [Thermomicrobiales bacterium]